MCRTRGGAALSRRVYSQHRQRYMTNVGNRWACVVRRPGDTRFRQGEVPFGLFPAALDFLAGLLENRVVSYFGSGRTTDQTGPTLVKGAVLGKCRERIPERSALDSSVCVRTRGAEAKHDFEVVQRIATEI